MSDLQATKKMTTARQQIWEGRTPGKQLLWRPHLHRRLMRQQRHGLRHPLRQHQHRLQVHVSYIQAPFAQCEDCVVGESMASVVANQIASGTRMYPGPRVGT